jgi:signal transduction histidine kinase
MAAIVLGIWLAHRSTRSLYALVEEVEALKPEPGPGVRLAARFDDDEIGVLARALDGLSARVAAFVAREHAFTRDASHELRTPLSVISSAAGQLVSESDLSERGRQHVQHICLSALQLQQAIAALLALAREETASHGAPPVKLVPLLERVIIEQSPLLAARPVEVQLTVPEGATLRAPEAALRVVLANLVGNAFAHTTQGQVLIAWQDAQLLVHNTAGTSPFLGNWPEPRPFDKRDGSEGNGLGLDIMRRLCSHYGLELVIQQGGGGVMARLRGQPAEA